MGCPSGVPGGEEQWATFQSRVASGQLPTITLADVPFPRVPLALHPDRRREGFVFPLCILFGGGSAPLFPALNKLEVIFWDFIFSTPKKLQVPAVIDYFSAYFRLFPLISAYFSAYFFGLPECFPPPYFSVEVGALLVFQSFSLQTLNRAVSWGQRTVVVGWGGTGLSGMTAAMGFPFRSVLFMDVIFFQSFIF